MKTLESEKKNTMEEIKRLETAEEKISEIKDRNRNCPR